MKKFFFLFTFLLAAMTAAAQTFIVGNLGYTVTDSDTKSVVVTKAGELSGELTIPSTVTFQNVTYTVTSIAKEGFSGIGITALTIPATVTTIGYYAFHGTNQLKKVTFSDGSDPINFGTGYERSFGTSDKEVYIGRDINRTGNYSNEPLFLNVTKATFGSKVTTIPGNIMSGQVNLATLVIGDGVKTIGNDAFKGVTDAAPQMSVTIGANVETIGDRAFQNCTVLKSISLPSTLVTIGEAAFENAGLTALTIPASVKEIKYYAFHGCGSLANIRFDDSDETIDFRTGYEYSFGDASKEVYLGRNVKRTGNYTTNRLFNCVTKATIGPKMTEIGGSLFDGNVELAEVTIGSGVKSIGGYAFRNCGTSDDVEEFKVTMGANVDSMGVCAFQYCTKLKSIVIPSKLKDIPNQAFEYTGLTALTIPATVTSTGYYAFHGCGSIASLRIEDSNDPLTFYTGYEYSFGDTPKEVYLGRNINRTGNYAGNRLSNWVTKLTVGNQVTEIAYNLFSGNVELADVTIGSGVKTIGNGAFYNCGTAEGIEEMTVKMGTNVETINAYAFQNCTTLKSITLPTTLTLISDQAFERTGLTSLTIPSSVTELKYYAFHGCGSLAKITFADSDTPITFGTGYEYSFGETNKEVYIGRNINRTGNYAGNRLFNCVSKLTIGDKVTEIVSSMFDGNVELAEVTIGKGVKSIGNYAFRNCGTHDDVEEMTVIMGTNVETINACAFQSCTKLQSITLPATLTLIGDQAFEWAGLTTLTIPASVTDIKYYAFHGCNNLAKITFDDTDTPVNFGTGYERSFGNTTKEVYMGRDIKRTGNYSGERLFDCISKLTVSDKVTEIGSSLFSGNVELASVTIGKRVKSLGNNAFYNCGTADGIEEMTVAMGDSVVTIGNGAFKNCTKLKTITLPNTLTLISDQAFENAGLTTITIPASVTDIKYYAFHGCNALTNIYFEDSETPVNFVTGYERSFGDAEKEVYMGRDFKRTGNYAGERPFNKVKKVTFGPKVTEIGSSMFNLNELMNVVVPWLQPITITENVFSNTSYQNATLWVPSGTTPTYKAANVWKKFLKMDCAYFYVNLEATKGGTISAGELSASNGKASDLFDRETDVVVTIKADEGYELKSLTVNGTAVQPANGQYTIKNLLADQTVVANFGLINYNLKYNLAGGALPQNQTNPATYTMETETFTLVNPEREGYTFEGWTGTGLEAATKTVTIAQGSMGNREYTATWKQDEIPGPEPQPTLAQGRLVIKQLADMNTPRNSHQIMETEDGIAVFGGHTTGFSMTMTAERYNRETNSWTQMAMPNYHDYSGSIILDDGQLLIMGGMSSNLGVGASNKCDIYNPETNTFTSAANLTVPRSMMKADRTESGMIYFMGCWYNSSYSVECYDQEAKTFSKAADGFNAYMPFVFAMRGERVVVAYEKRLLLVEDGTSTNVENDLLQEYTILKPWHEAHMKDYKLADGSAVVLARNNNKEAALLRIYDDATNGIQVEKIVDLPMTLPNNAATSLVYEIEASRIFCDNAAKKIFMMGRVDGDNSNPAIVEYAYASTDKLTGGSTTVYALDKRLDLYVIDGSWLRLADGTFISTGGNTTNDSRANFNPHAATFSYTLTKEQKGDANGDGSVDVADIAKIISIMAGAIGIDPKVFDVNGDGVVDVADIAAIITIMASK